MTETSWDVVIIGGGSAGLSAGLVLARARRRVLIIDGGKPRNRFASHMHGVLGREGTAPERLIADGREEFESYGGVFEEGVVVHAKRSRAGFTLTTDDGTVFEARRILVATGLRDELPDIEGVADHWGEGVVQCPYCDGYEARDQRIGVIGANSLTVHSAHMLRQWSKDVTLFTALMEPRTEDELVALHARGIRIDDRPVERVTGERGSLSGVEVAGGEHVDLDAIFVTPRMVPRDDLLEQLGADQKGSAIPRADTDPTGATSVPGVWAVGNATTPGALVPVAAGAGTAAAIAINGDLVDEEVAHAVEEYRARAR